MMMTAQRINCGRMHRAQHKNVMRWMGDKVVIPNTPYEKLSAKDWLSILCTTAFMVAVLLFAWYVSG